jgi:hypothetical protein
VVYALLDMKNYVTSLQKQDRWEFKFGLGVKQLDLVFRY